MERRAHAAAREAWAARRIQLEVRIRAAHRLAPDLALARSLADSGMPHAEDGRLYRAKPLTEPWRRWRDGAPITMRVYDGLGVSAALYMRLLHGLALLFVVLAVFGLFPLVYNLTGTQATEEAAKNYVVHSLGNADKVSVVHGVCDVFVVVTTMIALCFGAQGLRSVTARLSPLASSLHQPTQLCAANYTCMVQGLPRDADLSSESLVKALRALFSKYGDVITVSVAHANRTPLPRAVGGALHHCTRALARLAVRRAALLQPLMPVLPYPSWPLTPRTRLSLAQAISFSSFDGGRRCAQSSSTIESPPAGSPSRRGRQPRAASLRGSWKLWMRQFSPICDGARAHGLRVRASVLSYSTSHPRRAPACTAFGTAAHRRWRCSLDKGRRDTW